MNCASTFLDAQTATSQAIVLKKRNRQNSSSHLLNNICDEIRYERKLRTKLKDEEAKTAAAAFSSISYNTPSDERFSLITRLFTSRIIMRIVKKDGLIEAEDEVPNNHSASRVTKAIVKGKEMTSKAKNFVMGGEKEDRASPLMEQIIVYSEEYNEYRIRRPENWPEIANNRSKLIAIAGMKQSVRTTLLHSLMYQYNYGNFSVFWPRNPILQMQDDLPFGRSQSKGAKASRTLLQKTRAKYPGPKNREVPNYALTEDQVTVSRFGIGVTMYVLESAGVIILDIADSMDCGGENFEKSTPLGALLLELFGYLNCDMPILNDDMDMDENYLISWIVKRIRILFESGLVLGFFGASKISIVLRPRSPGNKGTDRVERIIKNFIDIITDDAVRLKRSTIVSELMSRCFPISLA
ncbi:hypothetical protein PRIPAC_74503 [Pristionchus pacificus]|uniref:Uncharacterized protein n=1 Tax=Pristionchus pacificus TaxID=54126 RepID=A0A2A6CGL1_PRIPA|nr:hypothetical protein PRIPAC_74503 [Pristionchus pacificus]|eukprot:PDM77203.1 hypothetical protein PRIPAC_43115 [Pristionchus pacificus]